MELPHKLYECIKACAPLKSIPITRKLHARLVSWGLNSSVFLRNHLIYAYSNCNLIDDALRIFNEIDDSIKNIFTWNSMIRGLAFSGQLQEAQQLFDKMPERDSVSWNSLMSACFHNGKMKETIKLFSLMMGNRFLGFVDPCSFSYVMKACASLADVELALQVHGLVEKLFDFRERDDESVFGSSMIDMYIKCGALDYAEQIISRINSPSLLCGNSAIYVYSKLYGVERALDLFHRMPEHDSVTWNTMVSILSQQEYNGIQIIAFFIEMCKQGVNANPRTFASVLRACASIGDLGWGAHLHARIVRMQERDIHAYVGSGLIDMYAKCRCLGYARRVFCKLKERNVVSWTSLIAGVANLGDKEEALALFKQMKEVSVASDSFALTTILGICSTLNDIALGKQIHAYAIRIGLDFFTSVGNAVVSMYTKCGNIQSAKHAFQLMPVKDTISWTAMITGFCQIGHVDEAREFFDEMPDRNVISWNSMLATYVQHGFWEEGLKIYILVLREGFKPDCVTFSMSISSCAYSALLTLGNQIIAQVEKLGFGFDVSVLNSVVTLYSRCGRIEDAEKIFDSIVAKNLVSWNAMMSGFAHNGQGKKVIETFETMLKMGFTPDTISYVSVLSGCSHAGLVFEGNYYFNMMIKKHKISPTNEHFACMVDLLGRAGLLEQAKDIIDTMPFETSADVWGALLGACRIHGNTKVAEIAVKHLTELDAKESSYVLLANIYTNSGELEGGSNVRKFIRENKIRKNPGYSWIEVDKTVHVFTVDDTGHPQITDFYRMLDCIFQMTEDVGGYVNGMIQARCLNSKKIQVALVD